MIGGVIMFRGLLIFVFFASVLSAKERFRYEISIGAMFQNEAPYLREWIEYHRLIGVDHFYLYNNNSDDDFESVLKPYIQKKIVEIIHWPSEGVDDWTQIHVAAFNDCLSRSKTETKWLALIDIDEYIVMHQESSLKKFLKPYDEKKGIAAIIISWQMFGTSGVWEIPSNQLMIETLTQRAPKEYPAHTNVKSIVKPKYCTGNWIHACYYLPSWGHTYSFNGGSWPLTDEIQINHYWLRSEKYLREFKAPRRAKYEGKVWSEEDIQSFIEEMNQEKDTSILRFVPSLKKRLQKAN